MQGHEEQPKSGSYNAEMSVTGEGGNQLLGRFIPPCRVNTDNFAGRLTDDSQNMNQTMILIVNLWVDLN